MRQFIQTHLFLFVLGAALWMVPLFSGGAFADVPQLPGDIQEDTPVGCD